jgi:histidinol-phosphate/aromatic aminotransferase/cobyric acid decarboxylase-like protein
VAIAADRAETDLVELLGVSPFSADASAAVKEFESDAELVYVSNPNRVTGASLSFSELRLLANATADGLLIVDEPYCDSFEISARPLIDSYANIIILRPLSSVASPGFADAGFAVADEQLIKRLNAFAPAESISAGQRQLIVDKVIDRGYAQAQASERHREALRLATSLNRCGVQGRITAGDFLLLRVADPKCVGNYLARRQVPIENIDGYPQMKNHMRFRLQQPSVNDRLLEAFQRMPSEYFRMRPSRLRKTTLRRGAEETSTTGNRMPAGSVGTGRERKLR